MRRAVPLALLCSLCVAAPVWADSAPDDAIKYRQQLYKVLGASLTGISMNLKQEVAFPANLPVHADAIAATLPLIAAATEQDTAGQGSARTKAKPAIWSDWATFERLAEEAVVASQDLKAAAATGDMGSIASATQALGGACKACHDKFRE